MKPLPLKSATHSSICDLVKDLKSTDENTEKLKAACAKGGDEAAMAAFKSEFSTIISKKSVYSEVLYLRFIEVPKYFHKKLKETDVKPKKDPDQTVPKPKVPKQQVLK